jgi:hypothetical protein
MKKINLWLIGLVVALLIPGCATGLIYTHTWQPLTLDMRGTNIASTGGAGDIKHIQFHALGVAWDSAAIGDIAKKYGINELYFADIETLSVLRIWNQYTVRVYGK